jgi:hypothetical protein
MKLENKYLNRIYNLANDEMGTTDYSEKGRNEKADELRKSTTSDDSSKPLRQSWIVKNSESIFEKRMLSNQTKREKEFMSCREEYFLKKILVIVLVFTFYGFLVFIWPDPMVTFMPIFSSTSCQLF